MGLFTAAIRFRTELSKLDECYFSLTPPIFDDEAVFSNSLNFGRL